jgi:hypothetical protein
MNIQKTPPSSFHSHLHHNILLVAPRHKTRKWHQRRLIPSLSLEIDGYLEPDVPAIAHRYGVFKKWKDTIDQYEGGYDKFTKGYDKFGFNVGSGGEVVYREWAPNAKEVYLIGDFSEWLAF